VTPLSNQVGTGNSRAAGGLLYFGNPLHVENIFRGGRFYLIRLFYSPFWMVSHAVAGKGNRIVSQFGF
jgi:hypothetical protein